MGEAYYDTGIPIRPIVWRAPNYQPMLLPSPNVYQEGIAFGVSGDGRLIAGRFTIANVRYFALWENGVLNTALITVPGEFRNISRDGVPIGGLQTGGSVRWTPRRGFEVLGGIHAYAASLGAHHVAGSTADIVNGLMGAHWDSCGQISLGRFNNLQTGSTRSATTGASQLVLQDADSSPSAGNANAGSSTAGKT